MPKHPDRPRLPRLALVSFALALAGLAASAYLTVSHYTDQATLVCQSNAVVNCVKVTTSEWSELFGIPVAVLGAAYYVAMVVLTAPPAWRHPSPVLRWARLLMAGLGVLFVVYLVAAEAVLIHALCEWCTVVHVVTILLFGCLVALNLRAGDGQRTEEPPARNASSSSASVSASRAPR